MTDDDAVLALRNVTKRFGDNVALDAVNLELRRGIIHALVGMNGSGKSTIVKILSGFYPIDDGLIERDEQNSAVAFVHQDLALIDSMTVAENLGLAGGQRLRHGVIDGRAERERAHELLLPFGLGGIIDSLIGDLTKAEATIVAIARALGEGDRAVLVLDEPTSTLPAAQTDQLLEVVRACAASGIAVLFISHRLSEVLSTAVDVTVLRNGRVEYSGPTASLTLTSLADLIGSATVDVEAAYRTHELGESVLTARGVGASVVEAVSMDVRRGEVVGIIGLLGSGVEEIGALLSGREKLARGTIETLGRALRDSDREKVGFLPSDRARNGVLTGLTAQDNSAIAAIKQFLRGLVISDRAETREITNEFARMTVHPLRPELPMQGFSGGNQQKVLFARWLLVRPDVLVADEPTQGIDIHAKAQILHALREYAGEGHAVVLTTGEPEEIQAACDRLLLIREGRIVQELTRPFTHDDVLSALHERN